jgi:arylsulfatase A-like enzyme
MLGTKILIEESRGQALRDGNWKYIPPRGKKGEAQLYDLNEDPGEQVNVAAEHPERVTRMAALLKRLVQDPGGVRQYQ